MSNSRDNIQEMPNQDGNPSISSTDTIALLSKQLIDAVSNFEKDLKPKHEEEKKALKRKHEEEEKALKRKHEEELDEKDKQFAETNEHFYKYSKVASDLQAILHPSDLLDFHINLLDYKLESKAVDISLSKNGCVRNILETVHSHFEFDPSGTGKLRLVWCSPTDANARAFTVLNNDLTFSELEKQIDTPLPETNLRVEEIPHDQVIIEPNEDLMPVCYYNEEADVLSRVSFFVKVIDGELIPDIKQRIKNALKLSDQDFEQFTFNIIGETAALPLEGDAEFKFEFIRDFKNEQGQFVFIGIDENGNDHEANGNDHGANGNNEA